MIQQQKTDLQAEIVKKIKEHNGHGMIILPTGSGKTKCIIDYITSAYPYLTKVLWVIPTRKLRDVTIPDEFKKWGYKQYFNKCVKTICYASLSKINHKKFDILILDEGHHLTIANSIFFHRNRVKSILLCTATLPEEEEKLEIIAKLNLKVIVNQKVDDAVEGGIIAPYTVFVVESELDDTTMNIRAGAKDKKFDTTELAQYIYLDNQVTQMQENGYNDKFIALNRMRFVYDLPSKQRIANDLLLSFSDDTRILIFCATINQANMLCKFNFHSKTDDKHFNLFNAKQINRLSVVNALNEGHNMTDVDVIVMVQVNSKAKNYIQRMGRALRWREGHTAAIYVLTVKNTVDEKWVKKNINSLNSDNILQIQANHICPKN